MVKWNLQSAPSLLISLFVGLVIVGALAGALWTLILGQFATIGALGNFTFSTIITNTSGSLAVVLLSLALLGAVIGALGYKVVYGSGSKR